MKGEEAYENAKTNNWAARGRNADQYGRSCFYDHSRRKRASANRRIERNNLADQSDPIGAQAVKLQDSNHSVKFAGGDSTQHRQQPEHQTGRRTTKRSSGRENAGAGGFAAKCVSVGVASQQHRQPGGARADTQYLPDTHDVDRTFQFVRRPFSIRAVDLQPQLHSRLSVGAGRRATRRSAREVGARTGGLIG